VVDAWRELPAAIKAGIVALVKAAFLTPRPTPGSAPDAECMHAERFK